MSIFGEKEPPRDSRPSGAPKEAIMGCAVASPQSKTLKVIIIVKCQIYKEQNMGKKPLAELLAGAILFDNLIPARAKRVKS